MVEGLLGQMCLPDRVLPDDVYAGSRRRSVAVFFTDQG